MKPDTHKNYANTSAAMINIRAVLIVLLILAAILLFSSQNVHAAFGFQAFPDSPDTDTQIRLDWSSLAGARIYRLHRDDGTGSVHVVDIDVDHVLDPLTYTDTGLQPETAYTYSLEIFSDAGLTNLIGEETAVASTTEMIKPYNLQAKYNINAKTALLSWNSSALATGSIIRCAEGGNTIVIPASVKTSIIIPVTGLLPAQFTVQSTGNGGLISSESDPVTVVPVDPPQISVASSGGVATISWGHYPQIGQFQLERAKWNGVSWDGWVVVNSALSGSNVTDTPASGGQYRYRLGTKAGSVYAGYGNIAGNTSGLPAPTGLKLTVINTGRIDLSWTNGAGNTADIQVLKKLPDGSFTQIAMLPGTVNSFSDMAAVTAGTVYTYRVRAYNSATDFSAPAEKSIRPALPNKPSAAYASIVASSSVRLDWTDLSDNELGFRIERLTGTGIFTEIGVVAADITTYTDTTVAVGHTYIYRIRAYNGMGNSAYANEVTIDAWDTLAPASLAVVPASSTRLDLTWSYAGTESYNTIIERKKGTDGAWAPIYTTALGTVKYSDTGLSLNTRYFYRVRKSLGTGSSGIPYPNNETGIGAYTLLANLTLHGEAASGNTIYLSWAGNSSGADIVIERKMPNGSFSAITTVGPGASGWYDSTGLVPSASYTYRIKARTTTNESLYSGELTVSNLYLEAPSDLGITVVNDSSIKLKWTDNSIDETGFEIWRYSGSGGVYVLYATVDKNIATFTDNAVHTGVQYFYRVRAYVTSGSLYSPFSGTASIGVGLINPPSNLYYTYMSSNQVLLRWTDTSDNESGFKVEWKIGAAGEWNILTWLSPNVTVYDVSNLNPYTKYYFRIRAYTDTGNADSVSEEIMVSTALPAAPSDVVAVSLSASQAKITWKDNSDSEDGFKILRKPSYGYYFTPLAEVGKNTVVYYDNNVQPGMKYYYKVVSYNATGSSESREAEARINTKAYFSDLGGVSWAKDAIENLAGLGVIKGVTETLYKPANTVSKAEFTSIVVRTFKFDTAPVGSLADVKSNKWYHREIMIAENLGIVSGDEKNMFYPEAAITREEIAMILFKALGASGAEYTVHDNLVLEKFADKNNISPHAVSSMATLVGEGIIEGLSPNTVGPLYTATRAQAAVFIYRLMNRMSK